MRREFRTVTMQGRAPGAVRLSGHDGTAFLVRVMGPANRWARNRPQSAIPEDSIA